MSSSSSSSNHVLQSIPSPEDGAVFGEVCMHGEMSCVLPFLSLLQATFFVFFLFLFFFAYPSAILPEIKGIRRLSRGCLMGNLTPEPGPHQSNGCGLAFFSSLISRKSIQKCHIQAKSPPSSWFTEHGIMLHAGTPSAPSSRSCPTPPRRCS